MHGLDPVGRRQPREPFAVLFRRLFADPADIAEDREPERVGIDAAEVLGIEGGLGDDIAVIGKPLQHEAVIDLPIVIQLVQQRVVPEGGGALVGDAGQTLRIKVLRDLAHDAHQFALPRGKFRRTFLDEIEQIFLRIEGSCGGVRLDLGAFVQVGDVRVVVKLRETQSLGQPFALAARRESRRLLVAVDAVWRQRVAAVEDAFDLAPAMPLLTIEDEVTREG